MIEARNITKHFGTLPALLNVSFTIQQGSVTGLIGPNGSGKTTLIRIMNGVLGANAGQVMIQGMNTSQETEKVLSICGTLTEQSGLYENMSGRDNLLFFADAFALKCPAERIDELVELLEIQDYQHRKVGTYSTGMKKRLGLARVLLHRPSILFLDEPTNGLDPDGIQMVLRILRRLNVEQGMTILISSHVLTQLSAVCNDYIFMEKGRIVEKGTEQEIIQRYQSEPRLEVEADMPNGWITGAFSPVAANSHSATFQLSSREQIPQLLRQLTESGQVYQARIEGNDLESIYFAIREANAHE
ncbi:ABC transporter ATP-binding protein [Paenibacillus silvae]|uniref:ABC transporter ATP-binding protein n=1 Tax=Paenibacillus silvae TaxID=1325358 RepID=A0ABQ1ZB79_9BACL|nr:ABC transporter ATP-binding protein [Paenibacillus silvae]GGH56180.1 ABC transporter ATP-binding protein [Paenibacillus silvae]